MTKFQRTRSSTRKSQQMIRGSRWQPSAADTLARLNAKSKRYAGRNKAWFLARGNR